MAAAKAAHEKGITIHTVGMGLEQGAPIPEKGNPGQFRKDAGGNVVISKLDEETLRQIAKAGEGLYVRASNADVGLGQLMDEVNRMEKTMLEERIFSDYAEKYQYFLLAGCFRVCGIYDSGRRNKRFRKSIFSRKKKPDRRKRIGAVSSLALLERKIMSKTMKIATLILLILAWCLVGFRPAGTEIYPGRERIVQRSGF